MTHAIDRRSLLASSAAAAAALAAPSFALAQGAPGKPPVARVDPVTEDLWGVKVTDPYRWMEAEGPEWKTYAMGEAAYAKQLLDAIPGRDDLFAAINKNSAALVAVGGIQIGGDLIFSQVRPAGADTFKLFVREAVHGQDRLLIDPDANAPAGSHTSLDWWTPSAGQQPRRVRPLAGRITENSTAHIMVTETGAMLPETIDRTPDAGPSWTEDSASFFYNRLQPGVAIDSIRALQGQRLLAAQAGKPIRPPTSRCWPRARARSSR